MTEPRMQSFTYPDELCETICKGIREPLDHDEMMRRTSRKIVDAILIESVSKNMTHNDEPVDGCLYDDVSGAALD